MRQVDCTATSNPTSYHNYPALVYSKGDILAHHFIYYARVFYFDPATKAYTEITSGTLNYSIAS